jgi:hypothetical protein
MATFTGFPWAAVIVYAFMVLGIVATGIVLGELWHRWRRVPLDEDQTRGEGWRQ